MSFTSLFATEAPTGKATPLVGAGAPGPLIDPQGMRPLALLPESAPAPLAAIDEAMRGPQDADGDISSALGFVPLPAPAPLLPPGEAPPAVAAVAEPNEAAEPADTGVPKPRIIMSPGPHTPNSAFFTQVLTQTDRY
jgi:hypothetical protein